MRRAIAPALALAAFAVGGLWVPWHNHVTYGKFLLHSTAPRQLELDARNLLLLYPLVGVQELAPIAWLVPLTSIIPEWSWQSTGFIRREWIGRLIVGLVVLLVALWATARIRAAPLPLADRPVWRVSSFALGLAVTAPLLLWVAIVKQALTWDMALMIGGRYALNAAPWICLLLAGIGERATWLVRSRGFSAVVFWLLTALEAIAVIWVTSHLHAWYAKVR